MSQEYIINKFLKPYKTKVNNRSNRGEYNKYSFRLVTITEFDYDTKTDKIAEEIETHFHNKWSSVEWTPYDPVLGHCDCLITLRIDESQHPKSAHGTWVMTDYEIKNDKKTYTFIPDEQKQKEAIQKFLWKENKND